MFFNNPFIFLDNNSTTKVDERVIQAMIPYFSNEYANASSTHQFGVKAHEAVKRAREQVANLIGADSNEIIFTSGATEALNTCIKGIAENNKPKGKHILTVITEHSAVLDTCKHLESIGFVVTYLPVKSDGLIDLSELRDSIRDDTFLVSVMFANNETGVIQSIKEIADITHSAGVLFLTDATQAIGKIPVNVDEFGIDILCLSGHKIYAPKGVGAIYVRQKVQRLKIPALIHGGGQERGMRSGTLNVPGIVALGEACAIAKQEMQSDTKVIVALRDYFEHEILQIEKSYINGHKISRLPNTSNVLFKGVDSEALIMGLSNPESDNPLIAVSNGSACSSSSIDPSHVLIAMGLAEEDAFCSIRFSLGKYNSKEEIDVTIKAVKSEIHKLRSYNNEAD